MINIESKVGGECTFKRNKFWVLMSGIWFDFSIDSLGAESLHAPMTVMRVSEKYCPWIDKDLKKTNADQG